MTDKEYILRSSLRGSMLGIFLVFLVVTLLIALRSELGDRALEESNQKIEQNTARIKEAVFDQCLATNRAVAGTNTVLETLVDVVSATKSIGEAEKASRVRRYESIMVPLSACSKP